VYNTGRKYELNMYVESVELNEAVAMPRKQFDTLRKGDKVTITYDSSIRKGTTTTFVVKGKSRSAKYNVDKVTMHPEGKPSGMKYYLYSRDGKDATLALGDMGATMTKIVKEAVSPAQQAAIAISKKERGEKPKAMKEDGHNDVESMKNKVKTAMSALQKMNTELGKLGDQDSLPTWWTNKVAVAVDKLDGMADYIDTQVESVDECASEDDFKPHMMYDPKTGKGYKANKYADHVRMDKMGYTHEKPEIKERKIDPADVDNDATDDDRKAADKNVVMQIRKAADLEKGSDIEFKDGKKGKLSQADAKKLTNMFNTLKRPADKEKFQKVVSKDLRSVKALLKRLGR